MVKGVSETKKKTFWKSRKKQFWAAAYKETFQWVEAETIVLAAEKAFGRIVVGQMSLKPVPVNPKDMTKTERQAFVEEFAAQHWKRTGCQIPLPAPETRKRDERRRVR